MSQYQEAIRGDYINAVFHGYFDRNVMEQEEGIEGSGIVIDDQFNFFVGKWHKSALNGLCFVKLYNGIAIWGQFKNNIPVGSVGIQFGQYQMYLHYLGQKDRRWKESAVLINSSTNLMYILELTRRQEERQINLDKTQKIGSYLQISKDCRSSTQWKIKIVDRCVLRSDGTVSGYSKYLKGKDLKNQLSKDHQSDYSQQEVNHINLVRKVMGGLVFDYYMVNSSTFLKEMSKRNRMIRVQQVSQGKGDKIVFISVGSDCRNHHYRFDSLGMVLGSSGHVYSIGNYNSEGNLHGLGVQSSKKGESFCGIFKQNLLTKEYSHVSSQNKKDIATPQLHQILYNQHLKSLNYINNCHYISQIEKIAELAGKIVQYTDVFQKEFQKRHLSYNDTEMLQEVSSSDHDKDFIKGEVLNTTHQETKRVGFIVRHSSKSPRKSSKSPAAKSPSARVVGKISNRQMANVNKIKGYQGRHFYQFS